MVIVISNRSYIDMKNLSIRSCKRFQSFFLFTLLRSQTPFLETHPYPPPSNEQYPIIQNLDHDLPYAEDGFFLRFDGYGFDENIMYPSCMLGTSCYDGHGGIDFKIPYGYPITAPADGYVIWASFSEPADPCPGGITPNGNQGTIIIAHGNDYFTVYLHMLDPLNVQVGENVETGDTLGFNGDTGCTVDAHLHFEVRKGSWFFDSELPYVVNPVGWWAEEEDPNEDVRSNRSDWLWITNSFVDDGENGFLRFDGPNWSYANFGYNNDHWTAPPTTNTDESAHYAMWVFQAENAGEHDIQVFMPGNSEGSTGAIYELYIKEDSGTSTKISQEFNQQLNSGSFSVLERVFLSLDTRLAVVLRDVVSEQSVGSSVIFDAIKITPVTSGVIQEKPESLGIESVYPNPFNSRVKIKFRINSDDNVTLKIIDLFGKTILEKRQEYEGQKNHYFFWNGEDGDGLAQPSGIYFFSIYSDLINGSVKVVYLK